VNGLDVLLLALIVVAGVSGYRRGATLQVFCYGGLLVGLFVAALLAPRLARLVDGPAAQAGAAAGTLFVLGALGYAAGWALGSRARTRTRGSRFGPADAVGGSAVGVLATLLAIWFVALNLVNGPLPQLAGEIRGSVVVRSLGATLPDPPSLVGEVRRFFNRFGFPEVFGGIPPEPAEPVSPPSRADAQAAYDAAAASTVKVIGVACDSIQEGSGFVTDGGSIVTNAHVVAGMREPNVQDAGGVAQPATVVFFDPDVDLAVLRVPTAPGPPLSMSTTAVTRGEGGAVLGYPEGGPLTAVGAAVRRTIPAVGHDIYGRGDVDRDVYEIQATIRPGNSGGPFVLPDGTVVGVVVASSTIEDGVGYAITAAEVLDDVGGALALRAPVATGPCLR
jgi:S1-C subfamily serine protease